MYLCMFFFFFFKQKTAYEMRISDWSSDVCSSDLFDGSRKGRVRRGRDAILALRNSARRGDFGADLGARQHAAVPRIRALAQRALGRASRWDRVSPYG